MSCMNRLITILYIVVAVQLLLFVCAFWGQFYIDTHGEFIFATYLMCTIELFRHFQCYSLFICCCLSI